MASIKKIGQGGHWWNIPELMAKMPDNIKLKCSVPSCQNRRNRISRWCINHVTLNATYGHPLGKTIPLQTLAPYIKEAEELIALNPDHSGLDIVRQFFAGRHQAYIDGKEFRFKEEYYCLWECLSLETIVARCAGAYILRERDIQQRYFKNPDRGLYVCLGQILTRRLRWKKYGLKRSPKLHLKYMGEQIHEACGLFFLAMAKAADARLKTREDRKQAMTAPWNLGTKKEDK